MGLEKKLWGVFFGWEFYLDNFFGVVYNKKERYSKGTKERCLRKYWKRSKNIR